MVSRLLGTDLVAMQAVADRIETVAKSVPGVSSAPLPSVPTSGRYVDVAIRRDAAARYGLTQERVQQLIATVVGGDPIGQTVEGRERYPIVVRYPRAERESIEALPGSCRSHRLQRCSSCRLGQVADITVEAGPSRC